MAKAMDVANFFIDMASKDMNSDLMTNLRLQKLLYFSQAWCLARYHKPLFPEDFTAWQFGPIVRNVYDQFNSYGRNPIKEKNGAYDSESFTDNELSVLIDVLSYYGKYATSSLVDMSHKTDPWRKHEECKETIPIDEIEEYFSRQERPFYTLDEALQALPIDKGKTMEDGTLLYE